MTRVVIAHDYLTQRGGAERVVLAMLHAFPDARIVTSWYDPQGTFPEFGRYPIETLLPRVPLLGRDARLALPLLARAFGRHTVRGADVVVCSSSGWAHGIGSRAPKIVYCHTPARWLHQPHDYLIGRRWPVSLVARAAAVALRGWDARAAASAHTYIANSTVVAERVRRLYGREPTILHPPVTILPDGPRRELPELAPGFLLTVARERGYKNVSPVIEAARLLRMPLVVVGGSGRAEAGVTRLAGIDDARLRWLYANCRALVATAYEDFGLTPVEAMAFGKPVLALRAGGYLDTLVEGMTGFFFDAPAPDAIATAIRRLDSASLDPAAIRRHSERFSLERFVAALRAIVSDVLAAPGSTRA